MKRSPDRRARRRPARWWVARPGRIGRGSRPRRGTTPRRRASATGAVSAATRNPARLCPATYENARLPLSSDMPSTYCSGRTSDDEQRAVGDEEQHVARPEREGDHVQLRQPEHVRARRPAGRARAARRARRRWPASPRRRWPYLSTSGAGRASTAAGWAACRQRRAGPSAARPRAGPAPRAAGRASSVTWSPSIEIDWPSPEPPEGPLVQQLRQPDAAGAGPSRGADPWSRSRSSRREAASGRRRPASGRPAAGTSPAAPRADARTRRSSRPRYGSASASSVAVQLGELARGQVQHRVAELAGSPPGRRLGRHLRPASRTSARRTAAAMTRLSALPASHALVRRRVPGPAGEQRRRLPRLLPAAPARCRLDEAVPGELAQVERAGARALADQPPRLARGQRPVAPQQPEQRAAGSGWPPPAGPVGSVRVTRRFGMRANISLQRVLCIACATGDPVRDVGVDNERGDRPPPPGRDPDGQARGTAAGLRRPHRPGPRQAGRRSPGRGGRRRDPGAHGRAAVPRARRAQGRGDEVRPGDVDLRGGVPRGAGRPVPRDADPAAGRRAADARDHRAQGAGRRPRPAVAAAVPVLRRHTRPRRRRSARCTARCGPTGARSRSRCSTPAPRRR